MGYEIDFIPTQEFVDSKLKSLLSYKPKPTELPITKTELLVYVMKESGETRQVMNHLFFNLNYLKEVVRAETIQDAIDTFAEHGRIWYCGWEYSKSHYNQDIKEVTNNVVKTFTLLKQTVPTMDYFAENDKYYDKVNEIEEQLEYFCDTCRDATIYEIMDLLRPFKEKDDDNEKDDEGGIGEADSGKPFYDGATEENPFGNGIIDNSDVFRPRPGDEVVLGEDGDKHDKEEK
jgi:hypothetical protein